MDEPSYRVVRVFNNNAVLARRGDDELVVVGRGIGYGRRGGDLLTTDSIQRQYFEVGTEKAQYLNLVNSIDPQVIETISAAVDLASDLLGELHPSVYLLLVDHLAFALQRATAGEPIHNPVLGEIKAVFPEEYGAAELVLRYVNSQLETQLPIDEAAFITLHLNAARTGASVKQPLQRANALASLVEYIAQKLGRSGQRGALDDLAWTLARVEQRLRDGFYRTNAAQNSIGRDLYRETELAADIIRRILGVEKVPREAAGEVAHLAVFLHGWQQDANQTKHVKGNRA